MNWFTTILALADIMVIKNEYLLSNTFVSEFGDVLFTSKKVPTDGHLIFFISTR